MMNKKIKRAMCGLAASLCLVGSTVPVFAETVDFICFNLYFGAPITTDKNGTAVMAELDAA